MPAEHPVRYYGKPSHFGISSDPLGRSMTRYTLFPHAQSKRVTLFLGHHDHPPAFGGEDFASATVAHQRAGQASLVNSQYTSTMSALFGG